MRLKNEQMVQNFREYLVLWRNSIKEGVLSEKLWRDLPVGSVFLKRTGADMDDDLIVLISYIYRVRIMVVDGEKLLLDTREHQLCSEQPIDAKQTLLVDEDNDSPR